MDTLIAIFIGAIAGVVAALCGVGGGVVMVPAFVYLLKMGQKTAVATSLAAIIFTAIFTSLKNQSNGLILWRVALVSGLASAAVGWRAADELKKLQDITLTRIFATIIIGFGVIMWCQSLNKPTLSNEEKSQKNTEYKKS